MSIPMIFIGKRGMDPHGTHEGASLLTRLTAITLLTWLTFIMLYIIFGEPFANFWAFSFLILDMYIIFGMILICLSLIFEVIGILALGINFRIELPKEETELITTGIYKFMRNPIVFGVILLLIGSFFIIPNFFMLIIMIINIITFNSKARDEEKFLLERFGKNYENYKKKVGRYLPFKIGK